MIHTLALINAPAELLQEAMAEFEMFLANSVYQVLQNEIVPEGMYRCRHCGNLHELPDPDEIL